MSCVCHAFASVHCCIVVTCWERADFLAFVCDVTFPCSILGQVWYLIVSIPDLCCFSYFVYITENSVTVKQRLCPPTTQLSSCEVQRADNRGEVNNSTQTSCKYYNPLKGVYIKYLHFVMIVIGPRRDKTCLRWYQNQPAQLQGPARIVKFRLEQVLI